MLWTKEAQRQGNCDDNDGGCVDPTVFHPAFGTFSVVVMGSAQSVVLIPEGEQKAHTHSCIAMSDKYTGNNDLFFLVVIVVIVAIVKSKVTSASD